ncbi:MAG TPA: hypothetical protein DD435_00575 [Cyanobacteria bacterium UBA8530]|nr:hypothetical protein [Cyanobacteria bacterium UBA8530]
MSELPEIDQRRERMRKCCVAGKISEVEVLHENPLQGTDREELQRQLANTHIVDVQRKGRNILFFTDRGSTLLLTQNEDAEVACQQAPVTEHPSHTEIVIHFDDGHTLDFVFPSLKDKFYFFKTDDIRMMEPLQRLGPEPSEISFRDFHKRLETHSELTVHGALTNGEYVSGIGPAYADEICFQAGIRPDRRLSSLLRADWERIYDKMQSVIAEAERVKGNPESLERKAFLTPRRGTDRGCPKCEGPLSVLHFGPERSYFCPHCQDGHQAERKRMKFW